MWFGLVGFYSISTIVGYLMPTPFFDILNIWFVNTFCRYTVKWSNSFISKNLAWIKVSKYCYVSLTIQLNKSFVYTQFKWSNSSIWTIDRTLSSATSPGQSRPRSNGNERVLCIPRSSSITRALPSDCFVSYPGHLLGGSYLSVEMQLVYSIVPANWAILQQVKLHKLSIKVCEKL